MKSGKLEYLLCSILAVFLFTASIRAQDFQRSYALGAGGQIRVHNISGDIKIAGYGGSVVEVSAYKQGRDRDAVQIEENSAANRLELGVRYPQKKSNTDASVDFVIRVPQSVRFALDASSVSGDVALTDVTGQTKADSVSGDVSVQNVIGIVNAHSVSGDLKVEIRQLEGAGDLKLSSISGDVIVTAPPDLDADIRMSSVSGSVKTDFPIQVHKDRYGPNQSASGRLGAGSRSLHVSSISGDASLIQKRR